MKRKDIDIYEILKNEEYGTELYTPKCGRVWHSGMANDKDSAKAIWTEDEAGREHFFDKNGKIYKEGEILLFPSNGMRDWSKFFKKGDVLVSNDRDSHIIFKGFSKNDYTTFEGKHWISVSKKRHVHYLYMQKTQDYHIEDNKDAAQTYINTIEKRLGGKLNRESLEVEKTQPEFKDGDIAFADYGNRQNVFIVSGITGLSEGYSSFISIDLSSLTLSMGCRTSFFKKDLCKLRLATEEEKKQLFSALEKEGKAWDAEKKKVVDLKPAFEIGKLYVFHERDEDGELAIIGELIDKNESEDTLTFGNQYEIENEKFVTDQAFDLRISVNTELREATENEVELFNKHYAIWKKEKEARKQPAFKTFDKVLVRDGKEYEWLPALFVRDRGEGANYRYKVLSLRSGKPAEFACCIPYEGNENIIFTDHNIDNLPS
jgi:hypothetical protein